MDGVDVDGAGGVEEAGREAGHPQPGEGGTGMDAGAGVVVEAAVGAVEDQVGVAALAPGGADGVAAGAACL